MLCVSAVRAVTVPAAKMKRGRNKDIDYYINVRIAQLKQDMDKAHDEYDKQWYNRIIQELCWVKSQQHNCYMQEWDYLP